MKARIVHDVAGTVVNDHIEGHHVTVNELHDRGYLVRATDPDGRFAESLHVSVGYSVHLTPDNRHAYGDACPGGHGATALAGIDHDQQLTATETEQRRFTAREVGAYYQGLRAARRHPQETP